MNKTILAIGFGIMTAAATTVSLAQGPGWGYGPCFQQGATPPAVQPGGGYGPPGGGYGPGRMGGMRGDPTQRINRRLDFLTRELDLTADQQVQVRGVLEEQQATRTSMRGRTHGRISSLLTDTQRSKFDQMRANLRGGRQGTWGPGGGGGPGMGYPRAPGYAPAPLGAGQ